MVQNMGLGRWEDRHYPPAQILSGGVSGEDQNSRALWSAF